MITMREYQEAFRWALLRLLDCETGRMPEPTPEHIADIIRRDADAQVHGE